MTKDHQEWVNKDLWDLEAYLVQKVLKVLEIKEHLEKGVHLEEEVNFCQIVELTNLNFYSSTSREKRHSRRSRSNRSTWLLSVL